MSFSTTRKLKTQLPAGKPTGHSQPATANLAALVIVVLLQRSEGGGLGIGGGGGMGSFMSARGTANLLK